MGLQAIYGVAVEQATLDIYPPSVGGKYEKLLKAICEREEQKYGFRKAICEGKRLERSAILSQSNETLL